MSGKKGPPNFRDSSTGKFVTEKYADKHPKTTEKEHNRPPPPKKKGPQAPRENGGLVA